MKKRKKQIIPWLSLFLALLCGCSLSRFAAIQTSSILVKALPVFERETNLEFAEKSIAGNIKLLEGLLEVTPDNEELLLLTARSYALYTFGFLEERIEIAERHNNFDEKRKAVQQAVDFYERARTYSIRLSCKYHHSFADLLDQNVAQLSAELRHFKKKHAPALFWTAYTWGNIIYLQQNDPAQLANLPKVDALMKRVLELDEGYYFGGPHLFYGVYYGGRPPLLGGDPEKARRHLQRAIEISGGKFLMAKLLYAKCYAVPIQDRELFEGTLDEILSAADDLFPEQGLANKIAQRNAQRWLTYIDELFL